MARISGVVLGAFLGVPLCGGHLRGGQSPQSGGYQQNFQQGYPQNFQQGYPQNAQQGYPQQFQQEFPQGYQQSYQGYQQGYPQAGYQQGYQPVYQQVSPYGTQLNQQVYTGQADGPQYFYAPEQLGQPPALPQGFNQAPPAAQGGRFSQWVDQARQKTMKGFQNAATQIAPTVNLAKVEFSKLNSSLRLALNSTFNNKHNQTANDSRDLLLARARNQRRLKRFGKDITSSVIAAGAIDAGFTEKSEMERLVWKFLIGYGIVFGTQHLRVFHHEEDDMLPEELEALNRTYPE